MTSKIPRVSIGLPTYNRPELLALVLENFRQQTFADFELIISDNASPDPGVRTLCERVVASDSRFRYVRQPFNQGAEANFWYVYDQARAPLFLWASDDDLWPLDFLKKGVAALDAEPRVSGWFCQVANINASGQRVREYPSFRRFHSTSSKWIDLARYLLEPEIMGKANLIYSVFRRESLREVIDTFRAFPSSWGSDMNLVYGFLCRFNLSVDDRPVLRKRVPADVVEQVPSPRLHIYPWEERRTYFRGYRRAAAGSGYAVFTAAVLTVRFSYDYWFNRRAQSDLQNWLLRWRARLVSSLRRIRKTISDL
jgi:glycosyltransferase involved in cell wall biosynthesis